MCLAQNYRRFMRRNIPLLGGIAIFCLLIFIAGIWYGEQRTFEKVNFHNKTSTGPKIDIPHANANNGNNNDNNNRLIDTINKDVTMYHGEVTERKIFDVNKALARPGFPLKGNYTVANPYIFSRFKTNSSNRVKNDRSYMEIRKLDSPAIGDFHCTGTAVENCCAFYIQSLREAKDICDNLEDLCKGFVLTTTSREDGTTEFLVYMKENIRSVTTNILTDFFIKTKFIKTVSWRPLKKP